MNKLYIYISLFVFLILTFCSPHLSFGIVYFSDNFSNNLIKWNFVSGTMTNEDSWKINNNVLVGTAGYDGFSYLYPILNSPLSDFTLQLDLMSVSGVDSNIIFRQSNDKQNYYLVGIRSNDNLWSQDNNNIILYKYENGYSLVDTYPSINIHRSFDITQDVWHIIKIVANGRSIKIYFDNILAINYYDSGNPIGSGKIALQNWGGNFPKPVVSKFDNFILSDGNSQNKIIFLPGMGASWNERAMVLNQNVAQNEWRMTPFVKNYDQMFKGFDDNGLVKGTDYFVYNYDWRKPLASQITDFDSYVNSLNLAAGEKIDVVGHSLGGVIGRIWTQENSSKVGKVLTLGSPNSGAVTTYEMWNGAKISNPTETSSIALNILLALQKKNNQTAVDTLRTYVPIVKDLLPTFNYLKKNGVIVVPPANTYLTSKNSSVSSIFPQLLAVSGLGFNTVSWINLSERSVFDSILNQWESGKPISYTYSDGDGTVLKNSAVFNGDGSTSVTSNHGNVPDKSVNLVLTELGLGKTIADIANSNFNGAVFYLGSPATIKVNCGGGDLSGTDGFVLVANKNISDCTVKLTGTDNGTYHLVMGNSNDNESWKYSEGNIVVDQNKNISVNVTDFWYEQMLRETNLLLSTYPSNANLKNMVVAINAKNRTNLLNYYLLFRKQKLENIITWRMVNYLERIINLELPIQTVTVIEKQKVLALSAKALADKTSLLLQRSKLLPNQWQSLNYNQGDDLILGNNYGKYLLAEKILGMVWY